jgi:hypothetical protein
MILILYALIINLISNIVLSTLKIDTVFILMKVRNLLKVTELSAEYI